MDIGNGPNRLNAPKQGKYRIEHFWAANGVPDGAMTRSGWAL